MSTRNHVLERPSRLATDPRRWQALALLCVASFMVILDASIVTVAVPSIERHLDFAAGGVQWVLTAYVITFGGLLLFGGRAADLFGRRRMFMAGVALFAVSSLLCGLAWTGAVLIAARAVQGIAAAIMTPAALSIVLTLFTERQERNRALGVWGAIAAVGGTAGSLIGGPVTDHLGWSWIFFINVPVGAALLTLGLVLLPRSREQAGRRPLDTGGAITITTALGLIVYGVAQAPVSGWAGARTIVPLVAAAAALALFAAVESRSAAPLVPLRVLRSRALVAGNVIMLAAGMAAYAQGYILSQYGQLVLGWTATQLGLAVTVMPVLAMVGSIAGQRIVTRAGVFPVVAGSMVLLGIACVLWSLQTVPGGDVRDMLPGLVVFGPGLGAGTVAASIAAVGGAPERDAGLASGINEAAFQIGGSLGVAIVSSIALSHTGASPDAEALVSGFRAAFSGATGFAVLGLLAALPLIGRARRVLP